MRVLGKQRIAWCMCVCAQEGGVGQNLPGAWVCVGDYLCRCRPVWPAQDHMPIMKQATAGRTCRHHSLSLPSSTLRTARTQVHTGVRTLTHMHPHACKHTSTRAHALAHAGKRQGEQHRRALRLPAAPLLRAHMPPRIRHRPLLLLLPVPPPRQAIQRSLLSACMRNGFLLTASSTASTTGGRPARRSGGAPRGAIDRLRCNPEVQQPLRAYLPCFGWRKEEMGWAGRWRGARARGSCGGQGGGMAFSVLLACMHGLWQGRARAGLSGALCAVCESEGQRAGRVRVCVCLLIVAPGGADAALLARGSGA